MLIGMSGGMGGALFVYINRKTALFRKKYISNTKHKVIEAILMSVFTTCVGFSMIYFWDGCLPMGEQPFGHPIRFFCEDHQYVPTLLRSCPDHV